METKSLLFGLIGFILGGLVVSIAATTIEPTTNEMSMSQMTQELKKKSGDDYDKAFIEYMTAHHTAAIDMAKLSADRAKHQEIKDLSNEIITAQEHEVSHMKQWQMDWKYPMTTMNMSH